MFVVILPKLMCLKLFHTKNKETPHDTNAKYRNCIKEVGLKANKAIISNPTGKTLGKKTLLSILLKRSEYTLICIKFIKRVIIYIYTRFIKLYPKNKKTGKSNKKRTNVAVIKVIRAKK